MAEMVRDENNRTRISRRSFLASASLAAFASPTRRLFGSPASATVRTPHGTLRGETTGGVRIFRGVPFAKPPVGSHRFRPPAPMESWSGERDATRFAASAMQWREGSAPGEPPFTHSEDCLYLNVWAPEGKGPFPVFVWIHGGGFVSGHAFEPTYDGSVFVLENIVCVTVAYRLGVLGFLDCSPVLGADYAGSANNGLRDLIAALEWVKENVSAFGGDPGRVTIGGESAGAKLTCLLMGSPSAQPLFHQMISESGGADRVWSLPNSTAVTQGFAKQWQEQTGKVSSSLATADPELLMKVQHKFLESWPQHFPLRAEIDGSLLPHPPLATISSGASRGKRLLLGTNRDESALFLGPHPQSDAAPKDLGNTTEAAFAKVFRHYAKVYPTLSVEQLRIRAVTAEEYWVPSIRVADAHLRGGGEAWMYRLDFAESSGKLKGYAYHSLDTGMVWGRPHPDPENAAAEAALARKMREAWSAFIHGKIPAASGLPAWPQYSSTGRPTLILDTESRIEQNPQGSELELWNGLL